jgi:immediate early response 3-interacting protein 1
MDRDVNDDTWKTVGWSNTISEPAFGASSGGDASIKNKLINLLTSVRTLMRSTYLSISPFDSFYLLVEVVEGERWRGRL